MENPDAKLEDEPQKATSGSLLGAAVGALIGGLIAVNSRSTSTETATIGAQIGDSAFSYWEQPCTANCVAVRTTDGRYQSITYTEKSNCR